MFLPNIATIFLALLILNGVLDQSLTVGDFSYYISIMGQLTTSVVGIIAIISEIINQKTKIEYYENFKSWKSIYYSLLFRFDLEIVNAFNQFLQQSSFFLSIINALLILWYWIKGAILKQTNTREFKIVNSCICFANIVLLNKAYDNKKITEVFNSVKDFFSGKNIAICVFVLIIIVAIILIVHYARKDDNYATPNETPVNNSANNSTATNNTQPQKPSTPNTKPKDASANALFFIILMVLLILIAAVVYILIAKYDIITNIINDADKGYKKLVKNFGLIEE